MRSAFSPSVDSSEGVEGRNFDGNSQIPSLFLRPGANPNLQKKKKSTTEKISLPGTEPRVEEVSSPER